MTGPVGRLGLVWRWLLAVTVAWSTLGVTTAALRHVGLVTYPESNEIADIYRVAAAYQEGELRIWAELNRLGMPRIEMVSRSGIAWRRVVVDEDYLNFVHDPSPGKTGMFYLRKDGVYFSNASGKARVLQVLEPSELAVLREGDDTFAVADSDGAWTHLVQRRAGTWLTDPIIPEPGSTLPGCMKGLCAEAVLTGSADQVALLYPAADGRVILASHGTGGWRVESPTGTGMSMPPQNRPDWWAKYASQQCLWVDGGTVVNARAGQQPSAGVFGSEGNVLGRQPAGTVAVAPRTGGQRIAVGITEADQHDAVRVFDVDGLGKVVLQETAGTGEGFVAALATDPSGDRTAVVVISGQRERPSLVVLEKTNGAWSRSEALKPYTALSRTLEILEISQPVLPSTLMSLPGLLSWLVLLSVAEWAAMRQLKVRWRGWVLGTVGGWLLGLSVVWVAVETLGDWRSQWEPSSIVLAAGVVGLVVGTGQWLAARRAVLWIWPLLVALSFSAGYGTYMWWLQSKMWPVGSPNTPAEYIVLTFVSLFLPGQGLAVASALSLGVCARLERPATL